MQTTMNLLDKALKVRTAPEWHKALGLNRNALHNARIRGHISPAIAGALAEEIGEDAIKWIAIAALESDKDSACKTRMLRKLPRLTSLYVFIAALLQRPRFSAL